MMQDPEPLIWSCILSIYVTDLVKFLVYSGQNIHSAGLIDGNTIESQRKELD